MLAVTSIATPHDLPLLANMPQGLSAAVARLPHPGEVQVWELALDQPPADAAAWLDAHERARAQRFVHALHRRRYVAAHAWMRRVLAHHLGCAPQELRFARGPYGKPALRDTSALRFNLSHSGEVALLALSTEMEIGIDIETLRPGLPDAALAQGVLTPAELAELEQLPPDQRNAAFFGGWAAKEACMKALGLGLAIEPRGLHVGLDTRRRQVQVLAAPGAAALDLLPLACGNGHAAALACTGHITHLTWHTADILDHRPT
jgi:4'-phosphopantetheinyl transferase